MKTLLGIIASPRKLGNSELFVRELYRQLHDTWELKLVRLPDLDIRSCRGCYKCVVEGKMCPQKDDFQLVLDALIRADAYVVAAPTYLLGPHSSLKRFLDRGLNFCNDVDDLWGKPAVAVAVAGKKGMEGYTKLAVESFVRVILGDLRGSAVVYGALPGEIFMENDTKEIAKRLAYALIHGKEEEHDIPVCPLCGGDTFRFLPNNEIRCMLCSSAGSYDWKDDHLICHMTLGQNHPGFLRYESAKRHGDVLKEMKANYRSKAKELKAITQQYTQEVVWIRPGAGENGK
jgi:multimeric flavodoxin WrbA